MSYLIKKNLLIAFVANDQLKCSKMKVKIQGPKDVPIYNFLQRLHHMTAGKVLICHEKDLNALPSAYHQHAERVPGNGSIVTRLEMLAAKEGLTCRIIDTNKDNRGASIASIFWQTHVSVSCHVLETDKESLNGCSLFIGSNKDEVPDYGIFLETDANQDVADSELGTKYYTLFDADTDILVTVNK